MDPVEIDVLLQRPVPVPIRSEAGDVIGTAFGGTIDTIIFDANPQKSPIGKKVDIWIKGTEFSRKVVDYTESTKTARVDPPWSKVYDDGSFIKPDAGTTYVIEEVEVFHLPLLGAEGLLPWLDEVSQQRQATLRKILITSNMSKRDKDDAEFSIQQNSVAVVSDLTVPIQQPAGMRRVLELSINKSDVPKERREKIVNYIMLAPNAYAHTLAQKLSTLFYTGERRPEPPKPVIPAGINQETQIPLPGGADAASAASPESPTTG